MEPTDKEYYRVSQTYNSEYGFRIYETRWDNLNIYITVWLQVHLALAQ